MEQEKVIIWVPKDTIKIKVTCIQENGTIEEKSYNKEDINKRKVTPFFDRLP